ncbi:LLM class F420-dependent oxidoreductase [Sciscionella marina]|uniref:LLM class F420-dependent oxidoreductase n=1 Tax=Sciscionella marina TaxID=508770 RepID=UPI000360A10A|nr:LLM class F420-dependent oxidoreductase [Sciscionella marina]
MRVSIGITNFSVPGGAAALRHDLIRTAQAADEWGIDTVWLSDHLLQVDPNLALENDFLEAYTTLGFLAAATQRVRLGTMVSGVTFRPPAVLIKAVTALDVLSGGRAWLGLGAGYHQVEADMMGLPMPGGAERFDRLTEAVQIAGRLWSGDHTPYDGTYYRLQRPVGEPRPLTRGHPPVLIGGMGERRTLPLVAAHADACNFFDVPDGGATIRHKLAILRDCCEDIGRDSDDIEKTVSTKLDSQDTAESFATRCATLAALGIDHVVVLQDTPWTPSDLARLDTALENH